jgi:hypothetical protein
MTPSLFRRFWAWFTTPVPSYFDQLLTQIVREASSGVDHNHRLENSYEFDVVERTENTLRIHTRIFGNHPGRNTILVDGLVVKIYPIGFNAQDITTYQMSIQW